MSERPYGVPLTDEERAVRHQALYGEKTLPVRGTGYTRYGGATYQTSNGTATIGKIVVVGGLVAFVAGVLILGLRK